MTGSLNFIWKSRKKENRLPLLDEHNETKNWKNKNKNKKKKKKKKKKKMVVHVKKKKKKK